MHKNDSQTSPIYWWPHVCVKISEYPPGDLDMIFVLFYVTSIFMLFQVQKLEQQRISGNSVVSALITEVLFIVF